MATDKRIVKKSASEVVADLIPICSRVTGFQWDAEGKAKVTFSSEPTESELSRLASYFADQDAYKWEAL